ncbi:MAG: hypothetical protein OXI79_14880 [Gammaproteobacteria bacterium]|nr:hypothetical protein [Gammaproteobacteria bacterium]
MKQISSQEIRHCVEQGFQEAKDQTSSILRHHLSSGASRLSSKFVYEVTKSIYLECLPEYELHVISVDDRGDKRSGEWLLDGCITEESDGFIERIVFAMESESARSKAAFDEDFAKLIHVKSYFKLYLNGLRHKEEADMTRYMEHRLAYAASVLRKTSHAGKLWLGFWPSPGKFRGRVSAWEALPAHLDAIYLWEFDGDQFTEVP